MKKKVIAIIVAGALAAAIVAGAIFSAYGGFTTGPCADIAEVEKYEKDIDQIQIPEGTRIIALGEATHGNKEFQELKLEVFKHVVENNGVRAFVIEGDFGGCECVNRYIHGEDGTAEEAAAAIGFAIYRTEEMAELIEWMRDYNEQAPKDEQLSFYGNDIQRYEYNYRYLLSDAQSLGIDTTELEKIWDGNDLVPDYTNEERSKVLAAIKDELSLKTDTLSAFAAHHVDILLENIAVGELYSTPGYGGTSYRDEMMAQNTIWALKQEEEKGNDCIFLAAHDGHIERNGVYNSADNKVMGHYLADEYEDAYFAIGTAFYITTDNLPSTGEKRVKKTFYSHDPIAKAVYKTGKEKAYIDFASVPADSAFRETVDKYMYIGSLGESYSILMEFLPFTYRVWRSPSETYDAIIYVSHANPTEIIPKAE